MQQPQSTKNQNFLTDNWKLYIDLLFKLQFQLKNNMLRWNKSGQIFTVLYGVDGNRVSKQNVIRHLTSKKTNHILGLRGFPYTKILFFDIDNHDDVQHNSITPEAVIYQILQDFDFPKIAFLERSRENGGYHFALEFDANIPEQKIFAYLDHLKKHKDIHAEVRSSTHGIRLPGSKDYEVGTYELEAGAIRFIPITEDWIEFYTQTHNPIPSSIFSDILEETYVKSSSIYIRKRKRVGSKHNPFTDFPFEAGERYHMMFRIASCCFRLGLPTDQFVQAVRQNDHGSRDFKKMSAVKVEEYCERFYKSFSKGKVRKCKPISSLISNRALLTDTEKKYIRFLSRKLLHEHGPVRSAWKKRYEEALPIFMEELLGKWRYEKELENSREIDPSIHLRDVKKKQLLVGVQFPVAYLRRIKSHYNLNCDVRRILRIITEKSDLFVQYKHNEQGWSFGKISFARQYNLTSTQILASLKSTLQSITSLPIQGTHSYTKTFDTHINNESLHHKGKHSIRPP